MSLPPHRCLSRPAVSLPRTTNPRIQRATRTARPWKASRAHAVPSSRRTDTGNAACAALAPRCSSPELSSGLEWDQKPYRSGRELDASTDNELGYQAFPFSSEDVTVGQALHESTQCTLCPPAQSDAQPEFTL